MAVKKIITTRRFEKNLGTLGNDTLGRVMKQIKRIEADPESGKPLRYALRGERSVRVGRCRLVYTIQGDALILLRFMHRKKAYRQAARSTG